MTSHSVTIAFPQTKSVEIGLEEHFLNVLSFSFFALVFGQSVFFLTACVVFFLTACVLVEIVWVCLH